MISIRVALGLVASLNLELKQIDVKTTFLHDEEKKKMESIPYSLAMGSLMYVMVCTRPDIAHAVGVMNADIAGDIDNKRSTSSNEGDVVVKEFSPRMNLEHDEYVVYCDGQSALDLSKSTMYHSRTKHIDVRYHWLRDIVEENATKLE
ncbi:Retrovirus-related Pol polyprotein from transposon TNT 1-94 [Vitis vinifera]|uniref:Retrovirus-related Pol polyprotein from transposon TNT 1-94 n=1 Tax=Vitis vinifera TaxID=29760 RepID=A0A438GIL2_VITVI|nr:Retrovirus-related Pol polyprotein from transposon TNT 1-94 [Vitis vinifera]